VRTSFNGALESQGTTQLNSLGWLEGSGIFETIRTVHSQPYLFQRHLNRALKSAITANISMPVQETIRTSIDELLRLDSYSDGLLRISFGSDGNWAAAHIPYEPINTAANVCTHTDQIDTAGESIKRYPYDYRLRILQNARDLGFDEALVVNSLGNVGEGAVTNLLINLEGEWITPPTSDGILPGIMRGLVIENFPVTVASLPKNRLHDVTAAILLSSLRIAQPIHSIDGRKLEASESFCSQIEAMTVLHSVD